MSEVFTHTDNKGRTLYAICAAIRMLDGTVVADSKCLHAEFANQAHRLYLLSLPPHLRDRVNVLSVGPAVGVFVEETDDKKLIVTV